MAFRGYPENPTFKALTASAYELGRTKPRPFRGVDLSGVQGVAKTVRDHKTPLGPITTPYGGSTRYEKFHPGIDIGAPTGTPVPAYAGGKVTGLRTGQSRTTAPSFGNYVIVTDPSGAQHRYSHLHQNFVELGQEVTPGMPVGSIGTTGSVYSRYGGSGSHLDYRIRDAYGQYVNPLKYLE